MFSGCENLIEEDLSLFNNQNVIVIYDDMLFECHCLIKIKRKNLNAIRGDSEFKRSKLLIKEI